MKHRQRGNKQQSQPKQDGYSKLLRGIAKREKLRRLQEGCPPMRDKISATERLEDYLTHVEKLPEDEAREVARRLFAGEQREAAPAQPLPPLDLRKVSISDRRKWFAANGWDTSSIEGDAHCNEPPAAERISIEPYLRQLNEQRREASAKREAAIKAGAVDLRHADPAIVTARLQALGVDDAVLTSGLRRHGLDEQQATSHYDGAYGARIALWRETFERAKRDGRSDLDAKREADKAAPAPGTPLPPAKRKDRPLSPNSGKRAPEPRTDARKMSPEGWGDYLRSRGLNLPTP